MTSDSDNDVQEKYICSRQVCFLVIMTQCKVPLYYIKHWVQFKMDFHIFLLSEVHFTFSLESAIAL